MSSHRTAVIHGGGVVFILLLTLFFLTAMPFGVRELSAQSEEAAPPQTIEEHSGTTLGDFLVAAGASGWLIILLGLAAALLTLIGAIAIRSDNPWPHWCALVRGLGEAAFLVGLAGTVMGMIAAMNEITRLGAAVTPKDMAGGITHSLVTVLFGTLVSLGSLVGAGILRLLERRPK